MGKKFLYSGIQLLEMKNTQSIEPRQDRSNRTTTQVMLSELPRA